LRLSPVFLLHPAVRVCVCAVAAECEWKSPCGAWPTLRLLLVSALLFSLAFCARSISAAAPRARGREARRQIDLLIAGHTAPQLHTHTLIANK
jgi:hypothetical protein